MNDKSTLAGLIDSMPVKITHNSKTYVLSFIKNNWEHHKNAYIVMYALINTTSISTVKPILKVQGCTLFEALMEMDYYIFKLKNLLREVGNDENLVRHCKQERKTLQTLLSIEKLNLE
ncbi:MAG: hypothetical protein ACRCSB_04580 [Bacteroidales bacterium]